MERRNLKDANKRAHFARIEEKRMMLRALVRDRSIHSATRYKFMMMLDRLPRQSAKGGIHNRCVSTGRSKGVYRQFKMSRICLRELMSTGALPGLKKASW